MSPDGALYIAEMYRGIIQHKTYLTPYLAGQATKKGLESLLSCGRIYKIVPYEINLSTPDFNVDIDSHLSYENSSNEWLRETAHNFIVDKRLAALSVPLHNLLESHNNLIDKINALWLLEGLNE